MSQEFDPPAVGAARPSGHLNPSQCAMQVGIFVVRYCGGAVVAHCQKCGRGICERHAHTSNQDIRCDDCDPTPVGIERGTTPSTQAKGGQMFPWQRPEWASRTLRALRQKGTLAPPTLTPDNDGMTAEDYAGFSSTAVELAELDSPDLAYS